jgi:PAS domain S-box-containing protein
MSTTRDWLLARLSDHGAVGHLTAAFDWSATELGPLSGWPAHLSTPVLLMLGSAHPTWLAWGTALTTLYNEACVPLLGRGRHPRTYGRPAEDVWAPVWHQCGPAAIQTAREGRTPPATDIRTTVERNGHDEEAFYSLAFHPIRDDAGAVAGLLCTMTDATAGRLGARRLATLSLLAPAEMQPPAWDVAAAALSRNREDIAFALLYQVEEDRGHARLEHAIGLEGPGGRHAPARVPLAGTDTTAQPWPLAAVAHSGVRQVVAVDGLETAASGARGPTPRQALVLPLRGRESGRVDGVLVAGLSPMRPLDTEYHAFFDLVACHLGAGIPASAPATSARPVSLPSGNGTEAEHLALEALARAERLDGILRQATVGFAQFDLTGRFVLMNARFCEMVGRSREELLRLRVQDVTHPEDLPAAAEPLRRAITTGEDFVIEKRYVRPDGSAVWVNNSVFALTDALGRPEHLVAISLDVTESRAAQERLRQSEARYRHIFDSVSVSLWEEDMSGVRAAIDALRAAGVTDFRRHFAEHPEFVGQCVQLVRIVNVNAASLRMFGASDKEQLLGSLGLIFEARTREVFADALLALAEGQSKFEAEAPHRTLAGEPLSVLVSIALPPPTDPSTSVLVSLTDITARKHAEDALKQSESHFRAMADSAPAMLWLTDQRAAVTFLSTGWYEFTGHATGAGSGDGWTTVVHPDDRLMATVSYAAAHRERQAFRVEYRLRRADGHYRWVIDAARPRFDPGGAFLGHIGAVIDIDERREAEQALQEAYRSLEHTSRVKDEFLATLSHELRTPLNAVLGWARMLRMGTVQPELRARALESMERNGKALLLLVEDLLDVSRIVAGKLQLKSELTDLTQIIAGAVDATRPTANAKGLAVEIAVDPARQVLVRGDADRLQQVVWNLLSNAAKFTPRGGRISISLDATDTHARIVVADTGQGISPTFLPHVFERFRQEDGTLTRKHTGLGLGLSIARHLVEAHGGTIAAESAGEAQGASFAVTLPLATVRPRPGPTAVDRNSVAEPLRGLRALVVDDDPDARELIRTMAAVLGADVTVAASAGEALHLIDRGPFDVVVADIGMPTQDGYAMIRTIRALPDPRRSRIPAIALTAHASVDDRDRALAAGFNRHLAKPVELDALTAAIADICVGRP